MFRFHGLGSFLYGLNHLVDPKIQQVCLAEQSIDSLIQNPHAFLVRQGQIVVRDERASTPSFIHNASGFKFTVGFDHGIGASH